MAKVIIAGGRDVEFVNIDEIVSEALYSLPINSLYEIDEVVNGMCPTGVDKLAREWAREKEIEIRMFYADWNKYGPAAGPKRNKQMAEYVGKEGFLIAIWDGKSKGTKNMIKEAGIVGLRSYIYGV